MNDEQLKSILEKAKTIAVVGCSRNETKAAHRIPKYLQSQGYKIIPVNPNGGEILGEKVYKSLSEIEEKIDVVDIFRPGPKCLPFVEESMKLQQRPELIFLQLGIKNADAKSLAEKEGVNYTENKCLLVEHKRLFNIV